MLSRGSHPVVTVMLHAFGSPQPSGSNHLATDDMRFLIEMALRIFAEGKDFFFGPNQAEKWDGSMCGPLASQIWQEISRYQIESIFTIFLGEGKCYRHNVKI